MNAEFAILYGPQGPIYLVPGYLQGTPICPVVNCTPHDFDLISAGGQHYRLAKTGIVARRAVKPVAMSADANSSFDMAVSASEFGPVVGLPDPRPFVLLIVSGMVLDAPELAHRSDLRAPDTAPDAQVRNPQGQIVGIRRLRVQARQSAPAAPNGGSAPKAEAPVMGAEQLQAAERVALEALGVRPFGGEGDQAQPYYDLPALSGKYPVPKPTEPEEIAAWERELGNLYNPFRGAYKEDVYIGTVIRSEPTWGLVKLDDHGGTLWVRWHVRSFGSKNRTYSPQPRQIGERVAVLKSLCEAGDRGPRFVDKAFHRDNPFLTEAHWADGLPSRAEREAQKAKRAAYKAALAEWQAAQAQWQLDEAAHLKALHGPSLHLYYNAFHEAFQMRWDRCPAESWLFQRQMDAERAAEAVAAAAFAQRRAAWEQADATYRRWDSIRAASWRVELVSGACHTGSSLYCTREGLVVLDDEDRRLPTVQTVSWADVALIQWRESNGAPGVDMTWGEDDDEWATSPSEWRTVWAATDDDATDNADDEAPSMADALARAKRLGVGA